MLDALKEIVGYGNYSQDAEVLEQHCASWRGGWSGKSPLILFPTSTNMVSDIVKYCAQHKVAIVPQGGNTGLVGGAVPDNSNSQILLNLSRMRAVRSLSSESFTATVESGFAMQEVQELVAEHDMLFPMAMASQGSAQVGGFVSTNAGGVNVLRYGTTRDLVLGVEAVLPNGEIFDGLCELRKDNTGYDLKQLLIGGEGTLGIITAVSFKLFPAIMQKQVMLLAIDDVANAPALLSLFRKHTGDAVLAFELMRKCAFDLSTKHLGVVPPLETDVAFLVLVELGLARVGEELQLWAEQAVEAAFEQSLVADGVLASNGKQAEEMWRIRETISESVKHAGQGVHFDISVPIGRIASFVDEADSQILAQLPTVGLMTFGHVGDGNLHYNLSLPNSFSQNEYADAKQISKDVIYALLSKYGGSISAEHGIGQERKKDLQQVKSAPVLKTMRAIKQAIDPHNIMNPGKML